MKVLSPQQTVKKTVRILVVLCTVCTHVCGTASGRCPDGWSRFGSSCYERLAVTKDWQAAENDCLTKSSHLVTVESLEENTFLYNFTVRDNSNDYWLGITRKNPIWKWISGSDSRFTKWDISEPDGDGDCARIVRTGSSNSAGVWQDRSCSASHPYVCERQVMCETGYCLNGGTCVDDNECRCSAKYWGPRCQNGTDPCDKSIHFANNDDSRRTTYTRLPSESTQCDSALPHGEGWYRFESRGGTKMPTQCVQKGACGSDSPVWLNDTKVYRYNDVYAAACTVKDDNCCHKALTIRVKICDGFYVHYLTPLTCPAVYCAGSETPCPDGSTSYNGFSPGCMKMPVLSKDNCPPSKNPVVVQPTDKPTTTDCSGAQGGMTAMIILFVISLVVIGLLVYYVFRLRSRLTEGGIQNNEIKGKSYENDAIDLDDLGSMRPGTAGPRSRGGRPGSGINETHVSSISNGNHENDHAVNESTGDTVVYEINKDDPL